MFSQSPWSVVFIIACLCVPSLSGSARAESMSLLLAPRFAVAMDPAPDDAQVALLLGFEKPFPNFRLGIYGEGEFRVFGKDRIVSVTPTLRLQFQEMRYTWGSGFYVALPLSHNPIRESDWRTEARLGGGAGYSLGEYRGTEVKPESRWVPWIDAGYGLRFATRGSLTLGYQYRPLPHTSPHRAILVYSALIHLGAK
jgi:hypothetical protein